MADDDTVQVGPNRVIVEPYVKRHWEFTVISTSLFRKAGYDNNDIRKQYNVNWIAIKRELWPNHEGERPKIVGFFDMMVRTSVDNKHTILPAVLILKPGNVDFDLIFKQGDALTVGWGRSETERPLFRAKSPETYHAQSPESYRAHSPEPYRALSPEPYHTQSPEPYRTRSSKPYRPQSPEPYRARSPEPYRARSPEPYRAHSSKPYRAQSPEPYRAHSPEPYRAHSPEPYHAQSPEPYRAHSPKPYRAQSPKPYRAQSPKPYRAQSPEPYRALSPEPYRAQSSHPYREPSPYRARSPKSYRARSPPLEQHDSNDSSPWSTKWRKREVRAKSTEPIVSFRLADRDTSLPQNEAIGNSYEEREFESSIFHEEHLIESIGSTFPERLPVKCWRCKKLGHKVVDCRVPRRVITDFEQQLLLRHRPY